MQSKWQRIAAFFAIFVFVCFGLSLMISDSRFETSKVSAQTSPTPVEFSQTEALAKLREQIKGKENEPAEKVFKNIQSLKGVPAGRLLAIMQMGYARSLGVDCTHCHVPDKWEAEDKNTKQIAREMSAMVVKINSELLKGIKNLKSVTPTINCTTCHRGEVKPALNLPMPKN
ncbi:MAG TPA: c-type cytochrome [Pyrinomonadaceae bacterium]|nr:c-type cytochrome [Pyrinomonadaceae bacterium]